MPIDPSIPLSGIQFRTQTPEQAISLAHLQQQMAAFDAQQRLAQSREARAQVELKMQQSEARQKASQAQLERSYKAYAGTQGPEDVRIAASRKAWLDSLQEMEESGGAAAIGLSPQELAKARQNIPTPEEMLAKSMSIKELTERRDMQQAAQADASTGMPLSQVGVLGPDAVAPNAGAVPPAATTSLGGIRLPDEPVIAPAPPDTPDLLRKKALQREAAAANLRALGTKAGTDSAKEADQQADRFRKEATALEQRIQKDTDQDIERQKLGETKKNREVQHENTRKQQALKLADDFRQEQAVKEYRTVQPLIASMQNAMTKSTPGSDLDMVYAVAKIFDPGSVVREGEQIAIVRSGGLPSQVQSALGYVIGGQRLSDDLRKSLLDQAGSRADNYKQAYDTVLGSYTDQAKRWDLDEKDIVRDYKVIPKGVRDMPGVSADKKVGGEMPLTNAKGWRLHTDSQGRKAYVSPDGKDFETPKVNPIGVPREMKGRPGVTIERVE